MYIRISRRYISGLPLDKFAIISSLYKKSDTSKKYEFLCFYNLSKRTYFYPEKHHKFSYKKVLRKHSCHSSTEKLKV